MQWSLKSKMSESCVVVHTGNPRELRQDGHSTLEGSLGYRVRPGLRNKPRYKIVETLEKRSIL